MMRVVVLVVVALVGTSGDVVVRVRVVVVVRCRWQ